MGRLVLTEHGAEIVRHYITELQAKRREVLEAGIDTCDDTRLPTEQDIIDDVNGFGLDEDGEYFNCWAVSDNYDADSAILLALGLDLYETEA